MPDWNRVTVPGMYMIQIIFRDREHVLEQESGTPAIKLSEDDGEAAAVFLDLFVMEGLELVHTAAQGNHPEEGGFFIFCAVESRAVCAVLLILHEHPVICFLKIFIFNMIYISGLVNHMPPPIKSALPCDRAENFRAGHLLDASGRRTIFSGRSFIGRQRWADNIFDRFLYLYYHYTERAGICQFVPGNLIFHDRDLQAWLKVCPSYLLHTQQIVRQQGFLKKRVPARGNAVRVPEIKAVGVSGADLMVFTYHKAVFVPVRVCKAEVLGAARQVHADICAGALQYGVGLFLYLKKGQDAFPAGEQKK
nr:hypothetical protein [Faecalibaculum rodentium]